MDDPLEEFPNRQTCAFVAVKSERHRPLYKPFISDGQLAPCGTAILIVSINGYEQRRVKLGACAEEKAMYALSVIRAYEILPDVDCKKNFFFVKKKNNKHVL